MNKLNKLEAIRGLAALYVVFSHLFIKGPIIGGTDFHIFFRFGQEAVIIFFLLSGFVIQYSFQKDPDQPFKKFFLRRFLRIYIPLFLIFLIHYLVLSLQEKAWISISWTELAGNIFMLQDIPPPVKPNVICNPFLGNTPLWSLSYEWWFYMLFFFFQKIFKQKSTLAVCIIGVAAAITYLIYPFFVNRLLMYLVIWWTGAEMAKWYTSDNRMMKISFLKLPLFAMVLCTGVLFANIFVNYKGWGSFSNKAIGLSPVLELRHFAVSIAIVVFSFLWKRCGWFAFKYTVGIFEVFAKISFAVYISHWFLIIHAHFLDFIGNPFLKFLGYFAICLLVSWLVEIIIYPRANKYFMSILYPKNVPKQPA